jgi:F-type H+-transporting ATPase subunit a
MHDPALTTNETIVNLDREVPELPNFITFLYHHFPESTLVKFLHDWENIVFSVLVATILSLVAYLGTRKKQILPSGFQNFLEFCVEKFDKLITEVLGPEDGRKFVPFLGSLFIYILAMNLFGLVPLMKAPSSNLNITIALALCVFVLVQFLNIKNMGIFGFIYHLAGSPKTIIEWALAPFLLLLELISQLARPVTLSLRLFGNVLGEDILIGTFALLGVTLGITYFSVGLPLQIPFVFLALLTSTMQALVFTLLSTVYILLSSTHKEEH